MKKSLGVIAVLSGLMGFSVLSPMTAQAYYSGAAEVRYLEEFQRSGFSAHCQSYSYWVEGAEVQNQRTYVSGVNCEDGSGNWGWYTADNTELKYSEW